VSVRSRSCSNGTTGKGSIDDAIASFYETLYSEQNETKPEPDEFVERLVRGVAENITDIDRRVTQHAEHWRIERMPAGRPECAAIGDL
jgi:N utilization substance protein B